MPNNLYLYNVIVRKLEKKESGILLEMGKGIRRQRGQNGRLSYQPASTTETLIDRHRVFEKTGQISEDQASHDQHNVQVVPCLA